MGEGKGILGLVVYAEVNSTLYLTEVWQLSGEKMLEIFTLPQHPEPLWAGEQGGNISQPKHGHKPAAATAVFA